MSEKSVPFNPKIIIMVLVIFGITSVDKSPLLRMIHGDEICKTVYNYELNETYSCCVKWNTTEFSLLYGDRSEEMKVINWLKTVLRAEITTIASHFPGIVFETDFDSGIYGYYVFEKVWSQMIFQVTCLWATIHLELP